jgi:hypothetical protein
VTTGGGDVLVGPGYRSRLLVFEILNRHKDAQNDTKNFTILAISCAFWWPKS